jgi:myo-inositol catabolism protein IolC
MDHRAVMRRLFERSDESAEEQVARFEVGKSITFRALVRLLDAGEVPASNVAVLVDERYGESVARAVPPRSCLLFMPVELSRPVFASETPELEFDYGDEWAVHLEAFPLDGVKLLVVHNPDLPEDRRARQAARCVLVKDWAQAHRLPFMLEVLTPPTPDQLMRAGNLETFERTLKPAVVARAIADLRDRGVEPNIWKLEPLPGRDDYQAIADLCRSDGRDDVTCLLLGGGADFEQAAAWVAQIRGVDGFSGFAIGRSLWQAPLTAFYDGAIDDDAAVARIAANLRRLVGAYVGAG